MSEIKTSVKPSRHLAAKIQEADTEYVWFSNEKCEGIYTGQP